MSFNNALLASLGSGPAPVGALSTVYSDAPEAGSVRIGDIAAGAKAEPYAPTYTPGQVRIPDISQNAPSVPLSEAYPEEENPLSLLGGLMQPQAPQEQLPLRHGKAGHNFTPIPVTPFEPPKPVTTLELLANPFGRGMYG